MKAIVCIKYGPPEVLHLKEVPKATPKPNEILIRNHAITVIAGDCEMRGFNFSYPLRLRLLMRLAVGLRGPRKTILGQELAGVVEEIGENVTLFREGDQVFAATGFGMGAYAEYTCVSEKGLVASKPTNMTFEEASTVPIGGLEALHFMRKANLQSGQKIVINGAGGSIGIFAIQLAKYWGADVTAVDIARKFDMMRTLGADYVIDYTEEDFTESGEIYDVIFDIVGKATFSGCMRSLSGDGIYLLGNGWLSRTDKMTAERSNRQALGYSSDYQSKHLVYLKELIEAGTIRTFIERTYPLEEMVEAHRYVETGQKIGNVVITVE
ncbi:MAG: NADPH:quinone reductase [Candidatus Thorarchaeota archaeon SMTZ-45]|nr:MAG: NADPH:quinone reductase [Candidatus Thorarchaeota archaeon SMTZ-45]